MENVPYVSIVIMSDKKNKNKMKNKVEIFTKLANVQLLSQTFGISEEDVIEMFCGDEYVFNKWYNSVSK